MWSSWFNFGESVDCDCQEVSLSLPVRLSIAVMTPNAATSPRTGSRSRSSSSSSFSLNSHLGLNVELSWFLQVGTSTHSGPRDSVKSQVQQHGVPVYQILLLQRPSVSSDEQLFRGQSKLETVHGLFVVLTHEQLSEDEERVDVQVTLHCLRIASSREDVLSVLQADLWEDMSCIQGAAGPNGLNVPGVIHQLTQRRLIYPLGKPAKPLSQPLFKSIGGGGGKVHVSCDLWPPMFGIPTLVNINSSRRGATSLQVVAQKNNVVQLRKVDSPSTEEIAKSLAESQVALELLKILMNCVNGSSSSTSSTVGTTHETLIKYFTGSNPQDQSHLLRFRRNWLTCLQKVLSAPVIIDEDDDPAPARAGTSKNWSLLFPSDLFVASNRSALDLTVAILALGSIIQFIRMLPSTTGEPASFCEPKAVASHGFYLHDEATFPSSYCSTTPSRLDKLFAYLADGGRLEAEERNSFLPESTIEDEEPHVSASRCTTAVDFSLPVNFWREPIKPEDGGADLEKKKRDEMTMIGNSLIGPSSSLHNQLENRPSSQVSEADALFTQNESLRNTLRETTTPSHEQRKGSNVVIYRQTTSSSGYNQRRRGPNCIPVLTYITPEELSATLRRRGTSFCQALAQTVLRPLPFYSILSPFDTEFETPQEYCASFKQGLGQIGFEGSGVVAVLCEIDLGTDCRQMDSPEVMSGGEEQGTYSNLQLIRHILSRPFPKQACDSFTCSLNDESQLYFPTTRSVAARENRGLMNWHFGLKDDRDESSSRTSLVSCYWVKDLSRQLASVSSLFIPCQVVDTTEQRPIRSSPARAHHGPWTRRSYLATNGEGVSLDDFQQSTSSYGKRSNHDSTSLSPSPSSTGDIRGASVVRSYITGDIVDVTATATLVQEFENTTPTPLVDASYNIQLPKGCVVWSFEAVFPGKVLRGIVKRKEEAAADYREAVAKGQRAVLVEQQEVTYDGYQFAINIGNLQPHSNVIIKLSFAWTLSLKGNLSSNPADEAQQIIDIAMPMQVQALERIDLTVQMPYPIIALDPSLSGVESHRVSTRNFLVKYEPPKRKDSCKEKFRLGIRLESSFQPRLWLETLPGGLSTAAMLVLAPLAPSSSGSVVPMKKKSARQAKHFQSVLTFVVDPLSKESLWKASEALIDLKTRIDTTKYSVDGGYEEVADPPIGFNVIKACDGSVIGGKGCIPCFTLRAVEPTHLNIVLALQFIQSSLNSPPPQAKSPLEDDVESCPLLRVAQFWYDLSSFPHGEQASKKTFVLFLDGVNPPLAYTANVSATSFSGAKVCTVLCRPRDSRTRADVPEDFSFEHRLTAKLTGGWCGFSDRFDIGTLALLPVNGSKREMTGITVDWTLENNEMLRSQINSKVKQSPQAVVPTLRQYHQTSSPSPSSSSSLVFAHLSNQLVPAVKVRGRMIGVAEGGNDNSNSSGFANIEEMIVGSSSSCSIQGTAIHRLTVASLLEDHQFGLWSQQSLVEDRLRKLLAVPVLTRLCLQYQLTSEFTSFVAVDTVEYVATTSVELQDSHDGGADFSSGYERSTANDFSGLIMAQPKQLFPAVCDIARSGDEGSTSGSIEIRRSGLLEAESTRWEVLRKLESEFTSSAQSSREVAARDLQQRRQTEAAGLVEAIAKKRKAGRREVDTCDLPPAYSEEREDECPSYQEIGFENEAVEIEDVLAVDGDFDEPLTTEQESEAIDFSNDVSVHPKPGAAETSDFLAGFSISNNETPFLSKEEQSHAEDLKSGGEGGGLSLGLAAEAISNLRTGGDMAPPLLRSRKKAMEESPADISSDAASRMRSVSGRKSSDAERLGGKQAGARSNRGPSDGKKIKKLTGELEDVKSVMMDSIDRVIERGEKIEMLVDKSVALEATSQKFYRSTRRLKRAMWIRNFKFTLLLTAGSVIGFLLLHHLTTSRILALVDPPNHPSMLEAFWKVSASSSDFRVDMRSVGRLLLINSWYFCTLIAAAFGLTRRWREKDLKDASEWTFVLAAALNGGASVIQQLVYPISAYVTSTFWAVFSTVVGSVWSYALFSGSSLVSGLVSTLSGFTELLPNVHDLTVPFQDWAVQTIVKLWMSLDFCLRGILPLLSADICEGCRPPLLGKFDRSESSTSSFRESVQQLLGPMVAEYFSSDLERSYMASVRKWLTLSTVDQTSGHTGDVGNVLSQAPSSTFGSSSGRGDLMGTASSGTGWSIASYLQPSFETQIFAAQERATVIDVFTEIVMTCTILVLISLFFSHIRQILGKSKEGITLLKNVSNLALKLILPLQILMLELHPYGVPPIIEHPLLPTTARSSSDTLQLDDTTSCALTLYIADWFPAVPGAAVLPRQVFDTGLLAANWLLLTVLGENATSLPSPTNMNCGSLVGGTSHFLNQVSFAFAILVYFIIMNPTTRPPVVKRLLYGTDTLGLQGLVRLLESLWPHYLLLLFIFGFWTSTFLVCACSLFHFMGGKGQYSLGEMLLGFMVTLLGFRSGSEDSPFLNWLHRVGYLHRDFLPRSYSRPNSSLNKATVSFMNSDPRTVFAETSSVFQPIPRSPAIDVSAGRTWLFGTSGLHHHRSGIKQWIARKQAELGSLVGDLKSQSIQECRKYDLAMKIYQETLAEVAEADWLEACTLAGNAATAHSSTSGKTAAGRNRVPPHPFGSLTPTETVERLLSQLQKTQVEWCVETLIEIEQKILHGLQNISSSTTSNQFKSPFASSSQNTQLGGALAGASTVPFARRVFELPRSARKDFLTPSSTPSMAYIVDKGCPRSLILSNLMRPPHSFLTVVSEYQVSSVLLGLVCVVMDCLSTLEKLLGDDDDDEERGEQAARRELCTGSQQSEVLQSLLGLTLSSSDKQQQSTRRVEFQGDAEEKLFHQWEKRIPVEVLLSQDEKSHKSNPSVIARALYHQCSEETGQAIVPMLNLTGSGASSDISGTVVFGTFFLPLLLQLHPVDKSTQKVVAAQFWKSCSAFFASRVGDSASQLESVIEHITIDKM